MMASELSNKDQKENESIIADAMMDENIIAKYLESHPDFFQRHADLLANIQVPRLQRFTLELMRADGIDDIIATCQEVLREDFNADFVTLKIIGGDDTMHFVDPNNKNLRSFNRLFSNKRPVCGRLNEEQQKFLFEKNTDIVNSTALVPLFGAEKIGILALGSEDESRFHPGMGTVFISHLGELISTSITYHNKA